MAVLNFDYLMVYMVNDWIIFMGMTALGVICAVNFL